MPLSGYSVERFRNDATADDGLSTFLSVRPSLLAITYRMLAGAAEVEDVVQDVWLRWQRADRDRVRDAAAFLVTTATRLAINVVQSARWRRETQVASLRLEPIDPTADSGSRAERRETVELGVQILLEKLSPTERAAYVLREAFGYRYRDIAGVLRLEEANARQVVTRARQHLANGRSRPANPRERRRFLDAFIAATRRGDVSGLESLLSPTSSPHRAAGSKSLKKSFPTVANRRLPRRARRDDLGRDIRSRQTA